MSSASIWAVTGGGVTKTTDAWGIAGMVRKRQSLRTAQVTFRIPGAMDVSPPVFAPVNLFANPDWTVGKVTITRAGIPWFQGVCTSVPRRGSAGVEEVQYVISDPWWWLEKVTFQQQWLAISGQVGGVIAKYEASVSRDGVQSYVVSVDKFPRTALDNVPGALVQTVDLVGSSITLAKQTVTVVSRPTANSSPEQALGC